MLWNAVKSYDNNYSMPPFWCSKVLILFRYKNLITLLKLKTASWNLERCNDMVKTNPTSMFTVLYCERGIVKCSDWNLNATNLTKPLRHHDYHCPIPSRVFSSSSSMVNITTVESSTPLVSLIINLLISSYNYSQQQKKFEINNQLHSIWPFHLSCSHTIFLTFYFERQKGSALSTRIK